MATLDGFIEFRQTKRGKWRAYYTWKQAIMSWHGDNFKSEVLRDEDDRIVEAASPETLQARLTALRLYQWMRNGQTGVIVEPQ